MPAHSETFPWPSYSGEYGFFESRMGTHSRVRSVEPQGDGLYRLTRSDGAVLRTFICECYSFGIAEYMETIEKLGRLDAIIINSAWCGYTPELKVQCRDEQVGLFDIRDFMAALNRQDFWMYLTEWEEGRLRDRGLL